MRTRVPEFAFAFRLILAMFAGALACSFAQPFAYVADRGSNVLVVNGATNTIVTAIPVSGTPTAVAVTPDGTRLYVTINNLNTVDVISTSTNTLLTTIPVGQGPWQLTITPNGATAYVANLTSNDVSAIDTATNTVIATIPVGVHPVSLAVSPDGSRVAVANFGSKVVSLISTSSNTVTATWQVMQASTAVAFSTDGLYAYVASRSMNRVSVHDAISGINIAFINGFNTPSSIAVSPAGGQVYVTNGHGQSVSMFKEFTWSIAATLTVGSTPSSVAVSADGSAAFVANTLNGTLSVINTALTQVVATIQSVGSAPASVAVYGSGGGVGGPPPPGLPILPQATVNTTYPTVTGQSIAVHAGSDFQAAVNSANCGDEVVLDAGAVFSGNFIMPAKSCSGQILIRSSAISSLPVAQRVSPASVSSMATLISPNLSPVLSFATSASGYYFAGLEFTVQTGVQGSWNLVSLSINATAVSQLPSNIIFDRVYAHGNDQYCVRGFLADAVGFALINSYVSGFTHTGYDTQAVMAFNSPGPYLISNNYLEATGENIMFGGGNSCNGTTCTPRIPGMIQSDGTITRNYFNKLYTSWNGQPVGGPYYDVKNSFEIKNGQRMLLDSNVFSYVWGQGQSGEFILLTPRTGCLYPPSATNCPDPQATASDITITNNLFQHGGQVFNGAGVDSYGVPYVTTASQRVLFQNNLAIDISAASYAGNGYFGSFQETINWTLNHNTSINSSNYGQALYLAPTIPSSSTPGPAHDFGLVYTSNIAFGSIAADGVFPLGAFQELPSSANVSYDLWVGDTWPASCAGCNPLGPPYPSSNYFFQAVSPTAPVTGQPACNLSGAPIMACWPLDFSLVGFVDFTNGNYQLASTSPYHNAASDGTDVGANIPVVLAATNGVVQ